MAKKSFKIICEDFFKKSLWDTLSQINVKSLEEAQSRLVALSGGKVVVSTATLLKTILNGIELGEVKEEQFQYLIPEEKESGKRGKASVQDLMEQLTGSPFWDLLKEKFSNITNAEDAAKLVMSLSNDKIQCTAGTIINTIMRGIESKSVSQDDFFVQWCPAPKIKKSSKVSESGEVISHNAIAVSFVCECGTRCRKNADILSANYLLALKAMKCPKCNEWGSQTAEFSVNGEMYRKAVKEISGLGTATMSSEEFIDSKNHVIPNPFL